MHGTCLVCGMATSEEMQFCPKCDNPLDLQHDGSTITVDIAHNGERVVEALDKLRAEIFSAKQGIAMRLRLVVGSGLIREEVLIALRDYEFRGDIVEFDSEPNNHGAVLVRLK